MDAHHRLTDTTLPERWRRSLATFLLGTSLTAFLLQMLALPLGLWGAVPRGLCLAAAIGALVLTAFARGKTEQEQLLAEILMMGTGLGLYLWTGFSALSVGWILAGTVVAAFYFGWKGLLIVELLVVPSIGLAALLGHAGLFIHQEPPAVSHLLYLAAAPLVVALPFIWLGSRLRQGMALLQEYEQIRHHEATLNGILSQADEIALVLSENGTIRFVVGGVLKALGWEAAELVDRPLSFLVHPEDIKLTRERIAAFLEKQEDTLAGTFRVRTKDNAYLSIEYCATNRLADPEIGGIICNLHDVSRLRFAEERLEFFACYDQLTQLPNRTRFSARLAEELARSKGKGRHFGVLALGLDRFKRINDIYGTEAGDLVLREAAHDLEACFRSGDLVCHLRGDVFLVLLSDLHADEAIPELVRKARNAVAHRYGIGNAWVEVTCSIGAALYPSDGDTPELLIQNAETAMYMAKEAGQGSWRLFDPVMNRALVERQILEDELGRAAESDDFICHFQPKIHRSGALAGMEALVRWPAQDGTMRYPGSFIETAERNGTICAIGASMLSKACRQIRQWREDGWGDIPVSVNLSPVQLKEPTLVNMIRDIVQQHRIDPALIELELTESGLMAQGNEGVQKLRALRDAGFTLSIDDFGTGYSSFSKLKDYPINILKIDKSFIDPLPGDGRAGTITRAIIDMAHSLGCKTVAEGVEREDQLGFLATAGCDIFQGYYYAKALSNTDCTDFLRNRHQSRRGKTHD